VILRDASSQEGEILPRIAHKPAAILFFTIPYVLEGFGYLAHVTSSDAVPQEHRQGIRPQVVESGIFQGWEEHSFQFFLMGPAFHPEKL
jgi:hypothetical protein